MTLSQDGFSFPPRWGRFFWLCWIGISKSGRQPRGSKKKAAISVLLMTASKFTRQQNLAQRG
jgi:hypothetical protein